MLAFMYFVPLAHFCFAKGRDYYMAAAYPMLIAMGAVIAERWLRTLPRWGRLRRRTRLLHRLRCLSLSSYAPASAAGIGRPAASNSRSSHSDDLREEIGWNELVRTVAGIRDSLPPDQQAHLGITTGNYGEYGAIEILGRAYGLPEPIGTTNSEWLRGYPDAAPTRSLSSASRRSRPTRFSPDAAWPAHNGNSEGVHNEESEDHPDIFVCGPTRLPWPGLWRDHQDFG